MKDKQKRQCGLGQVSAEITKRLGLNRPAGSPKPKTWDAKRVTQTELDLLSSLIEFAEGAYPDEAAQGNYVDAFIDRVANSFVAEKRPVDVADLRRRVKKMLDDTAAGEAVNLDPRELVLTSVATSPGQARYEGGRTSVFLFAVRDLLHHPDARMLTRCAAPGCEKLFIRRKGGKYCTPEHALAAKLDKRSEIPIEERRRRRHEIYVKSVVRRIEKAKGKGAARAVESKIQTRPRKSPLNKGESL